MFSFMKKSNSKNADDSSDNGQAYFERADKLYKQGKTEPALEGFNNAIECNQDILGAHVGRISCAGLLKRHKLACQYAEQAVEVFPQNGLVRYMKAVSFYSMAGTLIDPKVENARLFEVMSRKNNVDLIIEYLTVAYREMELALDYGGTPQSAQEYFYKIRDLLEKAKNRRDQINNHVLLGH